MSAQHAYKLTHPACDHLVSRLNDVDVKQTPFPHVYVTRAFPQDYYTQILANLPEDGVYMDRTYQNRMMVSVRDLNIPFWRDLSDWMMGWDLIGMLLEMFEIPMRQIAADVRLVRDKTGYAIAPHTDVKRKLMSLLFYLPEDEQHADAGTSIMVPKEDGFASDGSQRFAFDAFRIIETAPFVPNTMLGFPRSDVSFHGVQATTMPVRNVLLLNLYKVKT